MKDKILNMDASIELLEERYRKEKNTPTFIRVIGLLFWALTGITGLLSFNFELIGLAIICGILTILMFLLALSSESYINKLELLICLKRQEKK